MIERLSETIQKYWGYREFRPLQREAMEHLCNRRDVIVVLPTGGGKSLCFQVPALLSSGLALVVSPLISLMKDQVDALTECGVPAARIDSSLPPEEREKALGLIRRRELKLLYISPERLVSDSFIKFLQRLDLSFIAVDEAHCISMWGHDFRPEYRQLGSLRKIFPNVPIGAYTATATEQVRHDIGQQLSFRDPTMLVGSFDRPNLIYKVQARNRIVKQVSEVIDRHRDESGIVYCIRRKDVEEMAKDLTAKGLRVAPYHAGLPDEVRKKNQDDFLNENVDIIVATIAFGMGIDKSNVRYVIHAGLPKSLEHYQQESGRAGRDGLEAECCLFYSGQDYGTWKSLMRDMDPKAMEIAMSKLGRMYSYCTEGVCRRKAILNYFGQSLDKGECGACDICLGELDSMEDSLVIAQKILSCVLRLGQRFGGSYTALVLTGSRDQRIIENGHDSLTTYGLLHDHDMRVVQSWIEQLVGQGFLEKIGEYNVLKVTKDGRQILKGDRSPRLLCPTQRPERQRKARVVTDAWQGVHRGLFDALRKTRTVLARDRGVPAFVIFGDAALRDMARRRPSSLERFMEVKGVGQTKTRQYGKIMIERIRAFCIEHALEMDLTVVD
ncbi:MAG TPA: DNA helicase RecQ [Sedimentisphaerales bacterium]|nr:DNA helicase RecQ [Sedimentisphaerales bacterium]HQG47826.1 DNA helicase RecQ [Sedimentisphaerales bacterium]HQI27468.1 DNA helicase RecQ [Sedimentisphaerales bacterium]